MVALAAFAAEGADRTPDGLRVLRQQGWTASLLVRPAEHPGAASVTYPSAFPTTVNLRAWRRLSKTSRIAIDFTNLFDREAAPFAGNTLLDPAPVPGRGVVIRFRKSF